MNALEKLRAAARNMAKGRNLENHEEYNLLLVIADEIEAEVAESYLPLPVDRNGEVLRIGDEVWFHDEPDADPHIVRGYGMTNGDDVDVFINHAGEGWCTNTVTVPDVLVHRRPDPLKELLKDFAYKVCDLSVSDDDTTRYAERIRELTGGAE